MSKPREDPGEPLEDRTDGPAASDSDQLPLDRQARAKARIQARLEAAAQAKAEAVARARARAEAKAKARGRPAAQPPAADLTGKQRLIDAALRLHGEKRSFASLGIREIAREANLNPNTFYRHFESLDDLGVAAIDQIGERLRPMLRQIQRLASRVDPITIAALEVSALYAFVLGNPDAFVVGVTEYHCGSPRVRASISELLQEISGDLCDDIAGLGIFPSISRENLEMACEQIVVHLFHLSQDYIEQPERREYIIQASESMIVWMFAGAAIGTPENIASLNKILTPNPAS